MRYFQTFIRLLAIATLSSVAVGGHGHGHMHGGGNHGGHGVHGVGHYKNVSHVKHYKNASTHSSNLPRISSKDRTTIKNFFTSNPHVVSPTVLPPGIAQNLVRGKPLPPGIAKVYLPQNVLTTLPVVPGYEYQVVGNNVVLVNATTGLVSDIIANVLK